MKRNKAAGKKPDKKLKSPTPPEREAHVIERPDGFYWQSAEGERGPFETLAEAEADRLSDGADTEAEPSETLQEAESEVGIADWIDPETGDPAEGSIPHIEDH